MIQFNLLPDVKIEYIKARRLKRTVLAVSILVTASAVALMAVMGTLVAAQKAHLSDLNKDIASSEKTLRDTPDLNKILTIQNQLGALPELYKKRPVTSRLFTYFQKTTPVGVSLSHVTVDFEKKTMKLEGSAKEFKLTNQYADTLKNAMMTAKSDNRLETKNAFKDILLSNYDQGDKGTTYGITLSFEGALFDETQEVTLDVPARISTPSVTERPLFGTGN